MKLSRRGKHTKHARRGKHTKRPGKHLRYKSKSKKFSGSKRYHRGNKRTYKRGKRFHRGGLLNTYSDVMFLVRKKGPYPEQPQTFNITIELNDNVATVKLVRTDKPGITFTIKGAYSDVMELLYSPSIPIGRGVNVDFENLKVDNGRDTYDFYRDGNNHLSFKIIADELRRLNGSITSTQLQQGHTHDTQNSDPTRILDTIQDFKAMEVATNRSREWTENDRLRQIALQSKESSSSTTIGQSDLNNDYEKYALPMPLGGNVTPSYNNYVGRFNLVFDTLMSIPRMFDVYYSGELGNYYRDGLIHLFAVRSDPRTSYAKRSYNSEYNISSEQFRVFNRRNFSKIKNIYATRESTGEITLKDTPAVTEIINRLDIISRRPNSKFDWQEKTKNNDEQQNGWKPKVVD